MTQEQWLLLFLLRLLIDIYYSFQKNFIFPLVEMNFHKVFGANQKIKSEMKRNVIPDCNPASPEDNSV